MAQQQRRKKSSRTRRRPASNRKAARPAADRELAAFTKRLQSKERSIAKLQAAVQRSEKAQHDTEDKKRRLEAERDALRATLDVLTGQRRAAADERVVAARELKQATASWTAIQKRLRKHPHYRAIKAAVSAVDGEVDTLRTEAAALEKQVAQAEIAVSKATARLTEAEQERRQAQEAILRIPNDIRIARRNVARLIGDVQSASGDNPPRAVAAERELRKALEALREHARSRSDTPLVHALVDTRAIDEARARLEEETGTLNARKAELAKAQAALDARLQRRDEDIRTSIRPTKN